MDKRLEEYFVKQYPYLFKDFGGDARKTCMAWGCACGNGWFYLMNAAFKIAEHPGVILTQVKEKLAGLRLYWMEPGPPNFPRLDLNDYDKIRTALDAAENRSYQVCENCGAPGEMRRNGWLYTLCDRCHGLNYDATNYEANVRDELGDISDATGDKIAKKLGLRTTCATEKDHHPNHRYTDCVICKDILRVMLPSVECDEDKATVADCPQDDCNGSILKARKWTCTTCGRRVGVVQVVVPPKPEPEKITAMNCPSCDGELGEPDWKCDRCGTEIEVK